MALITLVWGGSAYADNLHLCDVSTGCSASSLIGTTSTTAYVTGTAGSNETLFLAILTPLSGTGGNFSSTQDLWTALGVAPDQVFPTLASAISQEFGATGISALSFDAVAFEIGAWTGSVSSAQVIDPLPSGSAGTIYMGFLEDADGNLIAVTPWSSSLVNVPEPGTLALLAGGLIGLALLGRKALLA